MKFVGKRVGLLLLLLLLKLYLMVVRNISIVVLAIDQLILIVERLVLLSNSSRAIWHMLQWSHGRFTINVHIIHIVHRRMKRMSGVVVEIIVVDSVLLQRVTGN